MRFQKKRLCSHELTHFEGRINKMIYLGFIQYDEARAMLMHYFDGISAEEERILGASLPRDVTPATLEQLCAEHDSIVELLPHLKTLGASKL
jgi:hypothetical protein